MNNSFLKFIIKFSPKAISMKLMRLPAKKIGGFSTSAR